MPITTTGRATDFITFSRPGATGGGATVTDSDGKIKWAPHNLLLASESFDAASWTKSGILTTGNWVNAIAAPNGTTTADLIRPSAVSANHYFVSGSLANDGTFTHAIFVRASGYTKFALRESAATGAYASFDTSTVSVLHSASAGAVTVSNPQITPIGGDWFLVTVKFAVPSGTGNGFGFWVLPDSYTTGDPTSTNWSGDGTKGIYVWGAHVFRGDLGGMQANTSAYPMYNPTTPKNLLGYTEDWSNAYWSKNSTAVSADVTPAPNELSTADMLQTTATTNFFSVSRSFSHTSGGVYTFSVYAKKNTASFIQLYFGIQTGTYANFDLNTGVAGTVAGATSSITPVSGGWYRCSITYTQSTADSVAVAIVTGSTAARRESYTAAGTESVYLWGAQLSDSASLDSYVPVYGAAVTSAAYYGPRRDFDPVTLACKGLLVEEQRANLLLQSNGFNTASWTKTRSSAAFVSGTAPDGSTTIAKITEDSTASESHLVQISATVVNGTTYTWTVYAKAGERTWLCLYNSNVTQGKFFNLSTGALGSNFVGAPAASSITPVGNGWYRCSISFAATGTSATLIHYLATADNTAVYTGDGTSGIYLWGAQLEAGSFATSYIPTGAATATRSADVASVSTQAFPYSASEGTWVAAFQTIFTGVSPTAAFIVTNDADVNKRLIYLAGSDDRASTKDTSTIITASGDVTGLLSKVASSYNASERAISSNGGVVATGAITAGYGSASTVSIGSVTTNAINGHIRQITYLPRRISNAELVTRTQ